MEIIDSLNWKDLKPKTEKKESTYLIRKRRIEKSNKLLEIENKLEDSLINSVNQSKANIRQNSLDISNTEQSLVNINQSKTNIKQNKVENPYNFKIIFLSILKYFNPSLIIGLIHVILNLIILFAFIYLIGSVLYFCTVDIHYKINSKKEETRVLIEEAKRLYILNRCDPSTRVPALEQMCGEWDCLIRNGMSGIKYTRIAIEMLGDIIDGFISKFSIKSILFVFSFLVIYLIFKR